MIYVLYISIFEFNWLLVADPDYVEVSPLEVPEVVKSGLQGSWLSKFFAKLDQVIIKSQYPEVVQFQDKVKVDLQEQKLTTEAMKA